MMMMMTDDNFHQVLHILTRGMMELRNTLKTCARDVMDVQRSMQESINEALLLEKGKARPVLLPVETSKQEGNLWHQMEMLAKRRANELTWAQLYPSPYGISCTFQELQCHI